MLKGRVVTAGMARAKRPAGWAASRDTPRRRDDFEFDEDDEDDASSPRSSCEVCTLFHAASRPTLSLSVVSRPETEREREKRERVCEKVRETEREQE